MADVSVAVVDEEEKVEVVSGQVERITFRNENDWTVMQVRLDRSRTANTIVGHSNAQPGQQISARGTWKNNPQFGIQFVAKAITATNPNTVEGLARYLGSGMIPGIGPGTAKAIVDTFGMDTLAILDNDPKKLSQVRGIGAKKAERIMKGWEEQRAVSEIMLFLNEQQIPPYLCRRIYRKYEAKAIEVIRTDPFRLALEVSGIGFKTADKIASKCGISPLSPQRIRAGLVYVMQEATTSGHCGVPRESLVQKAMETLSVPPDLVIETLEAELAMEPKERHLVQHGDGVYLSMIAACEERVASTLAEMVKRPVPWKIDADKAIAEAEKHLGFKLAEQQYAGVKMMLTKRVSVLTGGPGVGKAQPVDSMVLTPDGFVPIGSLAIGDEIIAADGTVSHVVGVFPQGEKEIYKITFEDGRSTRSCGEHLWKVWTRISVWSPEKKKKVRDRGWRVLSLDEIRARKERRAAEHQRMAVPLFSPQDVDAKDLPVNPYLLGALLGDGSLARMTFTSSDDDLLEKVSCLVRESGLIAKTNRFKDRCPNVSITGNFKNWLRSYFRECGLLKCRSYEKFIPEEFMQGSYSQRLELVRGLLDTDGTSGKNRCVTFSSTSEKLAKQLQCLVWSLGGKCSIVEKNSHFKDKDGARKQGRKSYVVTISHDNSGELFSLERKKVRLIGRREIERRLLISSIEPAGKSECVCIKIDHPDELYVTDDYIVTHNTSTLNVLLHIFKKHKIPINLAAPTGKAAQRAAEVTGVEASTIHRLLGIRGPGTDPGEVESGVLVIDESSMIDIYLMTSIVKAAKKVPLILVGDVDQLPSVGPGQVLADIINSGAVPVTRLTQVFRQAAGSLIIRNAHNINRGLMPEKGGKADDFFFLTVPEKDEEGNQIEASVNGERIAGMIADLVADRLPKKYGFDPIRDIMVLSPMNITTTGVANLNVLLQERLNPAPAKSVMRFGTRFGLGDKVIQTRNNYDLDIFNGDVGIIAAIHDTDESGRELAGSEKKIVVDFGGKVVEIPFDEMDALRLAYAMTVHKSQGSQSEAVVIPVTTQHFTMLQRNLFYTGVTRAKKLVVLVGVPRALAMAVRNDGALRRMTRLRDLLAAH